MAAIKSGRVKIVELLARRGLDAALLQAGWTGLCEATNKWTFALEINQAFLRILLEQGEPPEPTEGCLPLAVAARFGKPEMVEQIFGYGAALEVRDGSGKTPLHLAVAANQYRIVRSRKFMRLRRNAEYSTPFAFRKPWCATTDERFGSAPIESSFDDRYITRLLINGGADVNVLSRLGSTALRSATIYNQVPVIKELINAGVDVNQRDAQGKTALFYAAKCKHVEAIALLMIAGADPNNAGYTGRNLLDVDLERAVEFVREEMERTRLQN